MMKLIYLCVAIMVLSFIGVPIYKGVSTEHEKLVAQADIQNAPAADALTFEEIYEIADQNTDQSPDFLNEITPAAGDNVLDNTFSSGFSKKEDSALAETPIEASAEIENEIEETDL